MPLTMGLMWNELEESRRAQLERIFAQYAHLKRYWILEVNRWIGNELHRRFMVLPYQPRPMFGTICYFRDNTIHQDKEFVRAWCLPLDLPVPDRMIDEDKGSQHPGNDAWRLGLPPVY